MAEKKDIANYLELEIRTLYNWEKTRPKLYNFLLENFSKNNEKISKFDELKEYFSRLTEKEQEYFLSKIKITVIEKEIEKDKQ